MSNSDYAHIYVCTLRNTFWTLPNGKNKENKLDQNQPRYR